MHDQFVNISSLVSSKVLFEYYYSEAAKAVASKFKCDFSFNELDEKIPNYVEYAHSKFSIDYRTFFIENGPLASWERDVSVAVNFLVRATAAFPIMSFKGKKLLESTNALGQATSIPTFVPSVVEGHFNSVVAYSFGVGILSLEMLNYLVRHGYPEPNLEELNNIKLSNLVQYVAIIEEDSRKNFQRTRSIRRDIRISSHLRDLMRKNLPVNSNN